MITYKKGCYHEIIIDLSAGDYNCKSTAKLVTKDTNDTKQDAIVLAVSGIELLINRLQDELVELKNI